MADKIGPSAEEFAEWITPGKAARDLAAGVQETVIRSALLGRLRAGQIKAASSTATVQLASGIVQRDIIGFIRVEHWGNFPQTPHEVETFWRLGDVRFYLRESAAPLRRDDLIAMSYFDVRFDPADLRKMLLLANPNPLPPPAATPMAATTEGGDLLPKRDPVSDALLATWFTLYQQAYPDGVESHARKSAEGMFHDKHVARQKIRDLLGKRKPGRPKVTAK